jgi:hypothetical protein
VVASDQVGGPARFFLDGDELVVEVRGAGIAGGEQTRRYRTDGNTWERVS